jgi:hypothetical protein
MRRDESEALAGNAEHRAPLQQADQPVDVHHVARAPYFCLGPDHLRTEEHKIKQSVKRTRQWGKDSRELRSTTQTANKQSTTQTANK